MKRQVVALMIVAAMMPWPLLLTQGNWWGFVLVSAAIVTVLRLLHGKQWEDHAGLKLSWQHALLVVVAFALIATGSKFLLHHVYQTAGLRAGSPSRDEQIGFLFQAFNEEVFFRALMIGFFLHYVRSAALLSLGLAFLFAAAHFLMYRFTNPMHLALSIGAIATLFCAGVAWNNLYMTFHHIGFSWALHAGWNVVWLPAAIYDAATCDRLYEPQIFDRVLGSPAVVAATCGMAAMSFVFMAWHGQTIQRGRDRT